MSGRESGQIEGDTAQECSAVGSFTRLQFVSLQRTKYERVNFGLKPFVAGRWQCRAAERLEGPMPFGLEGLARLRPWRSRSDPTPEGLNLPGRECLIESRGAWQTHPAAAGRRAAADSGPASPVRGLGRNHHHQAGPFGSQHGARRRCARPRGSENRCPQESA